MARKFDDREDDDDDDDRPRRRKRKRKQSSGVLVAVFLILGVLVLAGGGVGLYFLLRGSGSARPIDRPAAADLIEEFRVKLQGDWEAPAPERPNNAKISLDVAPNSIRISAGNATGKVVGGESFSWKPLRAAGKNLVINIEGNGRSYDWSINFLTNDQMSVTSLSSPDAPVRTYTRIGKLAPKE